MKSFKSSFRPLTRTTESSRPADTTNDDSISLPYGLPPTARRSSISISTDLSSSRPSSRHYMSRANEGRFAVTTNTDSGWLPWGRAGTARRSSISTDLSSSRPTSSQTVSRVNEGRVADTNTRESFWLPFGRPSTARRSSISTELTISRPPSRQPVSSVTESSRPSSNRNGVSPDGDFRNTEHRNTEHRNTEHRNTEHRNTEYRNTEHRNTEYRNTEYRNTEYRNIENRKTEYRSGISSDGDFRTWTVPQIIEMKCDVMANWLYAQQVENFWNQGMAGEGVVVKMARDAYTGCPRSIMEERGGFYDAVQMLNVQCAMTIHTQAIKVFLRRQELSSIPLTDDLNLQILPEIAYLPSCQKHHCAAFIQDTGMIVVWDDDPRNILDRAQRLQQQVMEMTWRGASTSKVDLALPAAQVDNEKEGIASLSQREEPRRPMLIHACLTAATLALVCLAIGSEFRGIAVEIKVDRNWARLAFIAVVPAQVWVALFFMQSLASSAAQIFGPTNPLSSNSKFYSGKAPPKTQRTDLPHVTIQCPVYTEGLHAVISPTVKSIKAAIGTYEMQGGTANIFINDDGMQVIPVKEAEARRDFYEENNIGWVARPKHESLCADGSKFIRPGKFKKASNMNYALDVSVRIEEKLARIARPSNWTQRDESDEYYKALHQIVDEDNGRTWVEGNVRIGDYILLIDSDTRVPEDCLLDAVIEMDDSPQVAIIQFVSGVMNVTESFFERGITFFTGLVYSAIKFAVANGDVAPFVGHNAILRWSAIQDIAYFEDGHEMYWSHETVSEDFDMALRLQCSGYLVRLGAYTGEGFKEGVSLTVYDELSRWEKYAYGSCELIFNPLKDWLFKGPFTSLFRTFIFSSMPLPSKFSIMAYIGTYYAIASVYPLTVMNYFLIGWFNGYLDHYYLDSFRIYFGIVVVFTCLGNVALAVLRYRADSKSLLSGIFENFIWVPLLTIFLGGLSLHVFQAIFSHLFSINMAWGATQKEVVKTNFFNELPKVFKKFRWTFVICLTTFGVMFTLLTAAGGHLEHWWKISFFTAIFPLAMVVACHLLLPTVLNPGLMMFMF